MRVSYPSSPCIFADVPEIRNLSAEFVYNRFVPDEGLERDAILAENEEANRYVKLEFTPPTVNRSTEMAPSQAAAFIRENFDKIISEQRFGTNRFSTIFIDCENIALSMNDADRSDLPETFQLANLRRESLGLVSRESLRSRSSDCLDIRASCNVLSLLFKSHRNLPHSPFFTAHAQAVRGAQQIENRLGNSLSVDQITGDEYDVVATPVAIFPISRPVSNTVLLGLVLDRIDVETGAESTIIVGNPSTSAVIDKGIRYGATYDYTVKSVALIDIPVRSLDTGTQHVARFIVASKPSQRISVKCEEVIPPQPPRDFIITWDRKKDAPRLSWSFPIESQRDVKYFQVFARDSLNEPFRLLVEYDFNDALVQPIRSDAPNERFVRRVGSAGSYVDSTFIKDGARIFAVCCVDAHGHPSSYSQQLEVRFDRFANRPVVRMVSIKGAPRPYPNMHLPRDVFPDIVKVSGAKSARIYLDLDHALLRHDGSVERPTVMTHQSRSRYLFQLVNLDLQKTQVVEVRIDDPDLVFGPR